MLYFVVVVANAYRCRRGWACDLACRFVGTLLGVRSMGLSCCQASARVQRLVVCAALGARELGGFAGRSQATTIASPALVNELWVFGARLGLFLCTSLSVVCLFARHSQSSSGPSSTATPLWRF